MKQEALIIITGQVQGVGMRFTVNNMAQSLNLKGFVQNKNNGEVKIITQGETEKINEMIRWLKNKSPGKIYKMEVDIGEISDKLKKFEIKY